MSVGPFAKSVNRKNSLPAIGILIFPGGGPGGGLCYVPSRSFSIRENAAAR